VSITIIYCQNCFRTYCISEYIAQQQIKINELQGRITPLFVNLTENPCQLTCSTERTNWLETENRRLQGAPTSSLCKDNADFPAERMIMLQTNNDNMQGDEVF
jgi:hypothetical protein